MNGNRAYELKYENKINKLLSDNPELVGFYNYMSDKSLSTIYDYLLHVSNFVGTLNKQIKNIELDDFTTYLVKGKKKSNGESTTTAYRILIYHALKKYGKYLVAKKVISSNPMDNIDRPASKDSQETVQKREKGFLSQDEISQYIDSVNNGSGSSRSINRQKEWKERDIAMVKIFLTTGIRCSALMKLDINSIDFSQHILSVTDKEGKVNQYELADNTLQSVTCWLKKRDQLLNGKEEDALFISNRRVRMNEHSISLVVTKYAKGIEGKHITPHKLRATYGTQLYDKTGDIYFVQKCMHHSNPKTTELYVRGMDNQTKKASDIMSDLIK